MLDSINGFLNAVCKNGHLEMADGRDNKTVYTKALSNFVGELYCPKCGDIRKNELKFLTSFVKFKSEDLDYARDLVFDRLPVVYQGTCLQCNATTLLVVYQGPESLELAILHDTYGGCVTPNTPLEVKYYIDQAYRARSLGALSAAMAMYRSALEWLLYDQGFREGMLGKKIENFENNVIAGDAPKWAMNIEPDFLKAIKDIGNGAMHTNNGVISKQKEIDKTLIEVVDVVFAELLDKIYEQPLRSANNLSQLRSAASKIRTS